MTVLRYRLDAAKTGITHERFIFTTFVANSPFSVVLLSNSTVSTLTQCFEPFCFDGGIMDEHVRTAFLGFDEPISASDVEKLDCSPWHNPRFFSRKNQCGNSDLEGTHRKLPRFLRLHITLRLIIVCSTPPPAFFKGFGFSCEPPQCADIAAYSSS